MLQRPKAMFMSGLITGMLLLALVMGMVAWNSGQTTASNHWKVETSGSSGDFTFTSEGDLTTRVSQISVKCRVVVAPTGNEYHPYMLLDGCP